MKYLSLFFLFMCMTVNANAQETHIIEPAVLEVCYDSWQKDGEDSYILRVGRTANQFFSYYQNRTDSLLNTDDATMDIALNEFFESVSKEASKSEQMKGNIISREKIYQNLKTGKLSLYSSYSSAYNTYEEDIPKQTWTINMDTLTTILGMECHKATTEFRGRIWDVWFTEDIPVGFGPWKLGGLPGIILKATADNGYIEFNAVSIRKEGINPITFYNWGSEKYYQMTREKFLKYKNRPRIIPQANKVFPAEPYIELE